MKKHKIYVYTKKAEIEKTGKKVGHVTVGEILEKIGYSKQQNQKKLKRLGKISPYGVYNLNNNTR